jgi:polyketide synthase PksN
MSSKEVSLPNGMKIREINPHETSFLFNEIFVQQVYASYGLDVPADGLVLDIGANIGMFALYVRQRFPQSRVWSFEPAPHCVERLRHNVAIHADDVRIFPVALGDRDGETDFSYYPQYSILSGMFAEETRDLDTLRAGARTLYVEKYRSEPSERELDLLVGSKLAAREVFKCPVKRLSTVLAEEKAGRISLAKIDVERAEGLILAGIDAADLRRIDQFVVEVHDQGAREHETMAAQLTSAGYRCQLMVEPTLKNSHIYALVARR